MKIYTGCDLVSKLRVENLYLRYGSRFARRILTNDEFSAWLHLGVKRQIRYLAMHFAAKEAILKALGIGLSRGISWQDIEVSKDVAGKPVFALFNQALKQAETLCVISQDLSLSDEKEYVLATCVLLGEYHV